MAQGEGYWYNPINNVAVEVNRHERDIKEPSVQKKLKLHHSAKDEINKLPANSENEDLIKMIAARSGQIRARDWNQFTTVQLHGTGNKLKDILFGLALLIFNFREKNDDYNKLTPDTKKFARLLSSSWKLKIDNLATRASESISPEDFLKKYSNEGFLEERKVIKNTPIRDIPMSKDLVEEAERRLRRSGFFKNEDMDILFEDAAVTNVRIQDGLYNEDLSLSRVWKVANDGEHVFAMISGFRGTDNPEQSKINKERNKVLERFLRSKGYGFNKVDGYWAELNKGSVDIDNIEDTKEDSFFVTVRVPEQEADEGMEGATVSKFIDDLTGVIQGEDGDDDSVPEINDVQSGKAGFNQDMIAIKPDPKDPQVHLMDRNKDSFSIGEVEFFTDIRKTIKKLPKDIKEKLASSAGGIAFTDLKKGRSFRAGNLRKGE